MSGAHARRAPGETVRRQFTGMAAKLAQLPKADARNITQPERSTMTRPDPLQHRKSPPAGLRQRGRPVRPLLAAMASTLWLTVSPMAAAQTASQSKPVPMPMAAPGNSEITGRTMSLPATGLFQGDQLTELTKSKLAELIVDALGLDVEVALIVPTGPWRIDGAGHTERDLNEARLNALRKFLTDRGIEPKRIYVESRVDAKLKEPRLEMQLIGRPSSN
jgi:OOP family OmpA-OmpF porin